MGQPVRLSSHYEVAVIGSGVIGAAVAWQCAERKQRTLILDRYPAPHDRGSSHGQTRLLRVAYAEGERYVPLVRRAIALWEDLARRSGSAVFRQSGVLYAGQDHSPLIAGVRAAAQAHEVAIREVDLSARAMAQAALQIPRTWSMIIEDEGGYLLAEPAVEAMLGLAGATTYLQQQVAEVRGLDTGAEGVVIHLQAGARVTADRVVVCAGPWVGDLLPAVGQRVQVQRQLMHWFEGDPEHFGDQAGFRPFGVNDADLGTFYYGFPRIDQLGVKLGDHFARFALEHADERQHQVSPEDISPTEQFARAHLPRLGPHLHSRTCLYTSSASEDFLLDWARDSDRIYVCSGFSGHGFKFAPAIGEAVAQTLLDEVTTTDISAFGLA